MPQYSAIIFSNVYWHIFNLMTRVSFTDSLFC